MEDKKESIFDSEEFKTSEPEQPSANPPVPTSQTNTYNGDEMIRSAESDNELFFEKFNNTKKDHKKAELERARKLINKKNKSLGFERRLDDNRYVGMIYGIIAGIIVLILAISITAFTISYKFMVDHDPGNYSTDNTWWGIATAVDKYYGTMNSAVVIMSGIAFSLVPLPFFFLAATWFMGMNQVFRSRNFMLFLFVCIGLSALIVLITIPMFSVIYSWCSGLPTNNIDSWNK